MDIQKIKIDRLVPNDWNPNYIKPDIYKKLKRNIERQTDSVLPIVVRKHPSKKGFYQIIDGYHRFNIYKELGRTEIDVVVIEANDEDAKILTVNLNYLRGQAKPLEYARLIHDLSEKLTIDDLSLVLPDTKLQLLDRLELLKLPSDIQDDLKVQAKSEKKTALVTISFQVTAEEEEIIEAALKSTELKRKGAALTEMVKAASLVKERSLKT